MQVPYTLQLSSGKGLGLFAAADIKKGTIIDDAERGGRVTFQRGIDFRGYINALSDVYQKCLVIQCSTVESTTPKTNPRDGAFIAADLDDTCFANEAVGNGYTYEKNGANQDKDFDSKSVYDDEAAKTGKEKVEPKLKSSKEDSGRGDVQVLNKKATSKNIRGTSARKTTSEKSADSVANKAGLSQPEKGSGSGDGKYPVQTKVDSHEKQGAPAKELMSVATNTTTQNENSHKTKSKAVNPSLNVVTSKINPEADIARRDIKKGEELLWSYAGYCYNNGWDWFNL